MAMLSYQHLFQSPMNDNVTRSSDDCQSIPSCARHSSLRPTSAHLDHACSSSHPIINAAEQPNIDAMTACSDRNEGKLVVGAANIITRAEERELRSTVRNSSSLPTSSSDVEMILNELNDDDKRNEAFASSSCSTDPIIDAQMSDAPTVSAQTTSSSSTSANSATLFINRPRSHSLTPQHGVDDQDSRTADGSSSISIIHSQSLSSSSSSSNSSFESSESTCTCKFARCPFCVEVESKMQANIVRLQQTNETLTARRATVTQIAEMQNDFFSRHDTEVEKLNTVIRDKEAVIIQKQQDYKAMDDSHRNQRAKLDSDICTHTSIMLRSTC